MLDTTTECVYTGLVLRLLIAHIPNQFRVITELLKIENEWQHLSLRNTNTKQAMRKAKGECVLHSADLSHFAPVIEQPQHSLALAKVFVQVLLQLSQVATYHLPSKQ